MCHLLSIRMRKMKRDRNDRLGPGGTVAVAVAAHPFGRRMKARVLSPDTPGQGRHEQARNATVGRTNLPRRALHSAAPHGTTGRRFLANKHSHPSDSYALSRLTCAANVPLHDPRSALRCGTRALHCTHGRARPARFVVECAARGEEAAAARLLRTPSRNAPLARRNVGWYGAAATIPARPSTKDRLHCHSLVSAT